MRKNVVLLLLIFLGFPGMLFGDFRIDSGEEQVPRKEKINASLVYVGMTPPQINAAQGMGRDIPLTLAVTQIVPHGWSVFYKKISTEELTKRRASWLGAPTWTEALGRFLEREDGEALVNWDKRYVEIILQPRTTENIIHAENSINLMEPGAAEVESVQEILQPVKPIIEEKTWEVKINDGTISNTLRRWAEESTESGAPWRVAWKSPVEFPVMFEASFSGSFKDAVRGVLEALMTTEHPVEAGEAKNNVMVIVPLGTSL